MESEFGELDHKITYLLINSHEALSREAASALEDVIKLSTHTRIDGIADLEVTRSQIVGNGTKVWGKGILEIELDYGSSSDSYSDRGLTKPDSYPMNFEVLVDSSGEVLKVLNLEIDISSFHG